jgi:hypothetical protein
MPFVSVLVLLFSGCSDQHEEKGKLSGALVRGHVLITPDARTVLAAGNFGALLRWDASSGELAWQDTGIEQIRGAFALPESDRVLLRVYRHDWQGETSRSWHELRFWSPRTFAIGDPVEVSEGGGIGCWLNPTTVALDCYEDSYKDPLAVRSRVLVFFRLAGNAAERVHTFQHPLGKCSVHDVCRISDRTVLIYLRLVSDNEDTDPGGSDLVDSEYMLGLSRYRDNKGTSELLVYDVDSECILNKVQTEITAEGMWRTAVADGGQYCTVRGRKGDELRRLPSLELVRRLQPSRDTIGAGPGAGLAVSRDGRYLALGDARLELVEVASGKVHLLDRMNEEIVNSKQDLTPEGYPLSEGFARMQYCVAALRFVGDGSQLAAVTHDGVFTLWDCSTRTCLRRTRIAEVEYLGPRPK